MRWLWHPTRLVLILVVVATAAVPALRRQFVWQVRALARVVVDGRESRYFAALGGDVAPGIRPSDPAAELNSRPRDLQLRIGLASPPFFTKVPEMVPTRYRGPAEAISRRTLDEALALAPHDPVVLWLAALDELEKADVLYDREEQWGGRRAERRNHIPEDWQPKALSQREIARPLRALDAWAAADPGNAAPDALAAFLLFGANRDDKALARLEAASRKRYLTSYQLDIAEARSHVERLRGVPAADAAYLTFFVDPSRELGSKLRVAARIAQAVGWDRFEYSDKETAFRYWVAAGRVGTLIMRHERETMIDQLVGIAVQAICYKPIYRWSSSGQRRADTEDVPLRLEPGEAYDSFVAARGQAAAQRIRDELSAGQSLRREIKQRLDTFRRLAGSFIAYAVAHRTSMLVLLEVLMALVLCAVVLWLAGQTPTALTRPWNAVIIVLAFLGTPLMLVVACVIAAAWVARRHEVSYRAALGGALRQTLPTALAVLALIWVGAAAVAAREGAVYVKHMNRMYQVGELRMLQEIVSSKQ